jgi:putative PIN family toxin of toxin-antitoxin system
MRMRLVVDTNVFVEARFAKKRKGAPQRLVHDCLEGALTLVYTNKIWAEVDRVLKGTAVSDEFFGKVYRAFSKGEELTDTLDLKICDDPSDDIFFECAVSGNVPYIITRDNHLRILDGYKGIKVRTTSDFYQENVGLKRA